MEGKLSDDKAKHMFELIDSWKQSDINQQEFCKSQGIPYSKFHYWYKRYRQHQLGASTYINAGFRKIEITNPSGSNGTGGAWLVVQCIDGRQFSFNQPLGVEFIRQLMM